MKAVVVALICFIGISVKADDRKKETFVPLNWSSLSSFDLDKEAAALLKKHRPEYNYAQPFVSFSRSPFTLHTRNNPNDYFFYAPYELAFNYRKVPCYLRFADNHWLLATAVKEDETVFIYYHEQNKPKVIGLAFQAIKDTTNERKRFFKDIKELDRKPCNSLFETKVSLGWYQR